MEWNHKLFRGGWAVAMAFVAPVAVAQDATLRLYEGPAPGSEKWALAETSDNEGRGVRNVRDPVMTVYLPEVGKRTGTAAILLPGGALRGLSLGQENRDLIRLLTGRGIAAIVLKYRTLQIAEAPRAPSAISRGEFPKLVIRNANANPSPGDVALDEVLRLATADAQRALRMVRSRSSEWGIDPARVGFIGSSAGGGVAMGVLMAQAKDALPNFVVSLYGPSLQDVTVPTDAPPLFIATETSHGPVTDGLLALFAMWKDAGRPAELHVFDVPSFAMPVELYGARLLAWMEKRGLVR